MTSEIQYLIDKIKELQDKFICLQAEIDDMDCCSQLPCAPPSITDLTLNQDLVVGDALTLTVTATSDTPLTYQWKRNGVAITGATSYTYTIEEVDEGDAGSYTVLVTNSCGTTTSAVIVVVVIASPADVTVYWWWGTSDPYATLQAADTLTWLGSAVIVHNDPVFADFRTPSLAGVKFYAMKEPITEDPKVSWINTGFNYGPIPDQAWRDYFEQGGWRYYVTREEIGLFPEELTEFLSEQNELDNIPH